MKTIQQRTKSLKECNWITKEFEEKINAYIAETCAEQIQYIINNAKFTVRTTGEITFEINDEPTKKQINRYEIDEDERIVFVSTNIIDCLAEELLTWEDPEQKNELILLRDKIDALIKKPAKRR